MCLFRSFSVYLIYSYKGIDKFIEKFNINEVYTGLLIHESYIKKEKYFIDTNFFLPFFYFFQILTSYVLISYLEGYLVRNKVKSIIINKYTYFDVDSILFLIAKKRNLKCFVLSQEKVLKNNKTLFYDQKYSLNKNDLKKKISKKNINNFVNKKFKGLTDRDAKYSHNQKFFFNNRILNDMFPEKKRLTILFCPHVFSDSCSATGKFIFRDFFDFYLKTINQCKKINDINWIIKMHPYRKFYNETDISKKFNDKIKSRNIKIISDKYNILSVIRHVDAVVTAKGTIILEATILGKKVLAYENNRFEDFNFFLKYSEINDYYNKLSFKDCDLKVSQKDKDLSKRLLFEYNHKAYSYKDNIFIDERNKSKTQLDRYHSNLIKTFKKGKKVIYNSIYYQNLKKNILK